jgi:hypothetical protein
VGSSEKEDEMSIDMLVDAELTYRRDRFLAEAEAERLATGVRGSRPLDRLVDWVRKHRRPVVAARGAAGLHAS